MPLPDLDWLGEFPNEDRDLLAYLAMDHGESPVKSVGIAVSGGGDSLALLHLARTLSDRMGWALHAVTVDHGLRRESASEATEVAKKCAKWTIPHDVLTWNAHPSTGNLQAHARKARYDLIADWAVSLGLGKVLLGHTRDDIAENFLIRLSRKSGVDGLAAMAPRFQRKGIAWERPLWQASRVDLRSYLRRHSIKWIDDPSNDDPRFTRVKMRQAMDILTPLGITPEALFEASSNLGAAKSALQHYALEAASQVTVTDVGDVCLPLRPKAPFPDDINRRLLTAAFRFVSGKDYSPRQSALRDMYAASESQTAVTLHGCVITQTHEDGVPTALVISREPEAVKDKHSTVDQLWDGRWAMSGPKLENAQIKALGDGILDCPNWRETGFSRSALRASPAIWQNNTLISAPLAGFSPKWQAKIVTQYNSYLLSH